MDYCSTIKELHFSFLHQCSRIKFLFDSAQYHTARSQYILTLKFEYLGENKTKFENISTHWSVAEAGSKDEKNWGSKISLDCPFKDNLLCI